MVQLMSEMNYSDVITDILRRLRRVKVMMWAFDYGRAAIEIRGVYALYRSLLSQAEKKEHRVLQAKHDFDIYGSKKAEESFRQKGSKGRGLEYKLDIEMNNHLIPVQANVSKSDYSGEYAFMALARSLRHYEEQIAEAIESTESRISDSPASLQSVITPNMYRAYRAVPSEGTVTYRAYRLDSPKLTGTSQLIQLLSETLESNPAIVDQGDTELPFMIRFFKQDALIELALLDSERFTLTVVHSHVEMVEGIFEQIVNTILNYVDRTD